MLGLEFLPKINPCECLSNSAQGEEAFGAALGRSTEKRLALRICGRHMNCTPQEHGQYMSTACLHRLCCHKNIYLFEDRSTMFDQDLIFVYICHYLSLIDAKVGAKRG